MTPPIETAQALHTAIELGRVGQELEDLFTADATVTEYPNLIKPAGATADLPQLLAASRAGARLLSAQRYDVHHAAAYGNTAIMRLTWSGTVAADAGQFVAG